ncbi:4-hydroxyphenylpyruvate dioxygenase [Operophtera brumata]|uniref:4-hydroxyphenylpyruvate dioxygenase n=1 Tax=Operophtera brumata TaxID=104452 RepID=A0A0L7L1L2_OPEBR|nr:4-hydroxyphenylpyruvate dioxygenase [Operophtera brumata]
MDSSVFRLQVPSVTNIGELTFRVAYHGDFVKDVAFQVENLDFILEYARKQGAVVVKDLWEEKDEYGVVRMAYGDTTHTLVDRTKYTGPFLPGYQLLEKDPINTYLPKVEINFIDHVVGNQPEHAMEEAASWYERCLQFHSHGELGRDREAAHQRTCARQEEESDPGLKHSKVKVAESIDLLEKLNILIDYDDNGYLLQIFTKNTQDRPTLFVEVIQRRNHNGFGAGNFKTLFESIELEQEKRGNL